MSETEEIDVGTLLEKILNAIKTREDQCNGDYHRAYAHSGYLIAGHFSRTFEMGTVGASEELQKYIDGLNPSTALWTLDDVTYVARRLSEWALSAASRAMDQGERVRVIAYMDAVDILIVGVLGCKRTAPPGNKVEQGVRLYRAMLES